MKDKYITLSEFPEYEISRTGSIRRKSDGKLKNVNITTDGYARVRFTKEYKTTSRLLHRLLAITFIPNTDNLKKTINHKDGNKLNNNLNNLEWCTQIENVRHASKMGLFPDRRGENNGVHKLNYKDVNQIRYLRHLGVPLKHLAARYSVCISTINNIEHRLIWTNV